MSTTDQVFVLTGAASGIGRRLAGAIAERGGRVLALDLNEEALAASAREDGWPEDRVVTRRLDVRDPEAWAAVLDEAIERWGRIDVLLNVAGFLRPGWAHQTESAHVDLHFDVNVKGVIHGTRAAAERMIAQGSGHIVNIASMAGLAPIPGLSLYSASKFAVRGYTLAAALELRRHGVHVTCVCPDAVQTPMLDLQKDYEEAAMTFSGPKTLTPHDVERAILGKVLRERAIEVMIPPSRGWLAKLGSFFPSLGFKLMPGMRKKGLAAQSRARAR